jgi:hypothetical protein
MIGDGGAMTHAQLVERAGRWLRNTVRCSCVFTECSSQTLSEAPDAIGWSANGTSTLVECKTTLSDFYRDTHKPSRRHRELSMGANRYYMTVPKLLRADQIPEGWGLLEVHPRCDDTIVRVVVVAPKPEPSPVSRQSNEMRLLVAELRRISEGWRTPGDKLGLFVCQPEDSPRLGAD